MAQLAKVPLERTDDDRTRFHGCSSIREYEVLGKLGEGTFGSGSSERAVVEQSACSQTETDGFLEFSEVHKARSRKNGAIVALKKILMHNEKDGVSYADHGHFKMWAEGLV